MAKNSLSFLLRYLHRMADTADGGEVSDPELLERFARTRDEAVFELLVWRHGPMVLGLCQRLLRQEQDAEDAFQATFLALARKAGTIGKRHALASWLYTVAYRVACRARKKTPLVCHHPAALPVDRTAQIRSCPRYGQAPPGTVWRWHHRKVEERCHGVLGRTGRAHEHPRIDLFAVALR
jgi:hypothetical protein